MSEPRVLLKCPWCGAEESNVTDSRGSRELNRIRRRRECSNGHRYTTYETLASAIVDADARLAKADRVLNLWRELGQLGESE